MVTIATQSINQITLNKSVLDFLKRTRFTERAGAGSSVVIGAARSTAVTPCVLGIVGEGACVTAAAVQLKPSHVLRVLIQAIFSKIA